MSADRWERVQQLFEQALTTPPKDREAFLRASHQSDEAIADEVAGLLEVHEKSGEIATLPTTWLRALAGAEPPRFSPGDFVADRYEIRDLIGRGGMGEVYEAWDKELSIEVALKTLRIDAGSEGSERLLRMEGLLARSVWHPNVCRLYDLGRHGKAEDTTWFLTMELLRGETLSHLLRDQGRLSPDRALRLAEHMAAGLGGAHRAGIVHRDFKPGNVILVNRDGDEQAIVADFGIARAISEGVRAEDPKRGAGPTIGTPGYMAPEQLRGERVGPAADIYALGTVLYEMVTGTLPFPSGSVIEARRRLEDVPPPRSGVPGLDERWQAVILRCLACDPEQRFRRAEEVADALAGRAVMEEIKAVDLAARAPHSLPMEPDNFVGRKEELHALDKNLADSRLVTLVGAGGIGKTRLAIRYGWQRRDAWPGGVWFCDLTEARDENSVASSVARSLAVPLKGDDPVEQLGRAIAGRERCLVILDNFEQVVAHAASTVGRWLERSGQARFLVTSRQKLTLRGQERVQTVESLTTDAAMELFGVRARWIRPGLELAGLEVDAVREIVQLVDGMPLAIELAAGRMRVMSAPEIMSQMSKRFHLLTGGRGARHETLEAAIESSWELLRPYERTTFAHCSVFEGGFALDAAEAILDAKTWSEGPGLVDVLQSLVDKSLLRTWAVATGPDGWMPEARFGMYVSLQEFARAKLRENDAVMGEHGFSAERVMEERHGKWYAQFGTTESIGALNRHGGVHRLRKLEREQQNLIVACRRALGRRDGTVAAAAYRASAEVFAIQGPLATAVEMGREVATKAKLGSHEKAHLLLALARTERLEGSMREAVARSEEALILAREAADRNLEATLVGWLGVLNYDQGAREKTCALCEEALAIPMVGDRCQEGILRGVLGLALRDQGRLEEALANYEAALEIHREVGNRRYEGMVLGFLSSLHRVQGRLHEALAEKQAALAIYRELGNRIGEGQVLGSLGSVYLEIGQVEKARTCWEATLVIAREVGDKRTEGLALLELGNLHYDQGSLKAAHSRTEAALAIHRVFGTREMEAIALGYLGRLLRREGKFQEAREALTAGEMILRQMQCVYELAKLLCLRGELEVESGDHASAHATLHEAEGIGRQVGSGVDSELGRMLEHFRQVLSTA